MNYVELRAAIQEYSENFEASFVDNVDTFIQLAESRLMLRVRLPNFRKEASGSLASGVNQLAMPSDFLSPDSVLATGVSSAWQGLLLNKDPEFIRECYPAGSPAGQLRFYAMTNEADMLFGPAPDEDYTLDLAYYYQPPSIIVTGTSWLGDHFAHALVSGSLVEACTYMKTEDNLYQRYDQAFEKDLAMDQQYAKGRTKKDTYQEPDVRVRV
jgi:hypothetical protein